MSHANSGRQMKDQLHPATQRTNIGGDMDVKIEFEAFIAEAWNQHASDPGNVAKSLVSEMKAFASTSDQIAQIARLGVHVFGEHLGQWDEGVDFLKMLLKIDSIKIDDQVVKSILRSIDMLRFAKEESLSLDHWQTSDRVMILVQASVAMSEFGHFDRLKNTFQKAVAVAESISSHDDPCFKQISISANNLAANFEVKPNRDSDQSDFMIFCAQIARKYWEIVGTWKEVERAEYRLAKSFIASNDLRSALIHGQQCLEIVSEHGQDPLEMFFAYEVLGQVEKKRQNHHGYEIAVSEQCKVFDLLTDDDKSWAKEFILHR
jgi:hypothetical protein